MPWLRAGWAGEKGIGWSMGRVGILMFFIKHVHYDYRSMCFRLPSFKVSTEAA